MMKTLQLRNKFILTSFLIFLAVLLLFSAPLFSETNLQNNIPNNYQLEQNYPNPFNPTTKISYSIPVDSYVKLKVYNMLGNEVAVLINKEQSAGSYSVVFDASNLPSGIYFYRLQANDFTLTKKLTVLK